MKTKRNYAVCLTADGQTGSQLCRVGSFARAATRARSHRATTKQAVGVWSDISDSYLLTIAADGTETKPAKTCPDSIRLRGLEARTAWETKTANS